MHSLKLRFYLFFAGLEGPSQGRRIPPLAAQEHQTRGIQIFICKEILSSREVDQITYSPLSAGHPVLTPRPTPRPRRGEEDLPRADRRPRQDGARLAGRREEALRGRGRHQRGRHLRGVRDRVAGSSKVREKISFI